jgi:hypothetical protein
MSKIKLKKRIRLNSLPKKLREKDQHPVDDYNAHLEREIERLKTKKELPVKRNKWYKVSDRWPPNSDDYIVCKHRSIIGFYTLSIARNALHHIMMDTTYYHRETNVIEWFLFDQ